MMAFRLSWVLVLCGLAACASGSRPTAGQRSLDPMAVRRRLWSVVDTLVVNRSAAIARYGPPVTVIADTVRMLATDALDSSVTIRFRTFESYYHVRPDGRTELWHVTIAVPGTTVPPQVSPGVSRQSLVDYLGPPDGESKEPEGVLLLYSLCPADQDCNVLNILLADDRVRSISWVFFPDEPSWPPQ